MPPNHPRAFVIRLAMAYALTAAAMATPVDISHPVFHFLRRLEIQGRVDPGHLSTLPVPKS